MGRSRGLVFRHSLAATWGNPGIEVRTAEGRKVKVSYAGTQDGLTCCAYVKSMGFIGGWQDAPKKAKLAWRDLVNFINAGYCYTEMNDLPGKRPRAVNTVSIIINPAEEDLE